MARILQRVLVIVVISVAVAVGAALVRTSVTSAAPVPGDGKNTIDVVPADSGVVDIDSTFTVDLHVTEAELPYTAIDAQLEWNAAGLEHVSNSAGMLPVGILIFPGSSALGSGDPPGTEQIHGMGGLVSAAPAAITGMFWSVELRCDVGGVYGLHVVSVVEDPALGTATAATAGVPQPMVLEDGQVNCGGPTSTPTPTATGTPPTPTVTPTATVTMTPAATSTPGAADEYFIYSSFDPPGISDVVAAGGYVEYYGIPEWGDEIQYVYFLSGTVGYKVRVWVTDGDGDGVVEPRQHPNHYLSAYQGPVEPRHFEIVSSSDLVGYTSGSGSHTEEFHIDSGGVYLGAYPYGIHKWDHDWNYLEKVANPPPERTESLAYNAAENVWYAGGRYRTVYELTDTDTDGSFLDESWVPIFTYPSYGGGHHDGMEYVGGYLWISDMTSDVIGKWEYDPASGTWVELKRFTYSQPGDVEGMGFGPNDHFWIGSGWGSGSYIYELGNEITRGYPIANAGADVEAHPPHDTDRV